MTIPNFRNDRGEAYDPTRFHIVSPAGDRPWVMLWVAVTIPGAHWIYREWPSDGSWAERKDGKWVLGEAATSVQNYGKGFMGYASIIKEIEGEEKIQARVMTDNEQFIRGMYPHKMPFRPPFQDADAQETLQKIHALMEGDKLKILPDCKNLLAAIPGYDVAPNESGKKHAWFPWIECLGHIAVSELRHIDPGSVMGSKGGSY